MAHADRHQLTCVWSHVDLQSAVTAEHFETETTAMFEDGWWVFASSLSNIVRLPHHRHVRRLAYSQSTNTRHDNIHTAFAFIVMNMYQHIRCGIAYVNDYPWVIFAASNGISRVWQYYLWFSYSSPHLLEYKDIYPFLSMYDLFIFAEVLCLSIFTVYYVHMEMMCTS